MSPEGPRPLPSRLPSEPEYWEGLAEQIVADAPLGDPVQSALSESPLRRFYKPFLAGALAASAASALVLTAPSADSPTSEILLRDAVLPAATGAQMFIAGSRPPAIANLLRIRAPIPKEP